MPIIPPTASTVNVKILGTSGLKMKIYWQQNITLILHYKMITAIANYYPNSD